jgi:2,3-bisphosphoglycerate-independent phosphoglycerate mutase
MVGHTGNLEATIKAVETIDNCLKRIAEAMESVGGELLITADHGNAEKLCDKQTKQAHTAHTSHPVPFIYVGKRAVKIREKGVLSDVAPTMLHLLGLDIPDVMTGQPLIYLTG